MFVQDDENNWDDAEKGGKIVSKYAKLVENNIWAMRTRKLQRFRNATVNTNIQSISRALWEEPPDGWQEQGYEKCH